MSYVAKGSNIGIPAKRYSTGEVISNKASAIIEYYPPTGITIDHWRITLFDNSIFYVSDSYGTFDYRVNRITGVFKQLDSAGSVLKSDNIDIKRGNNVVVTLPATVPDHVELDINYIEIICASWSYLNPQPADTVYGGTGNEWLRIATEDASNTETSSARITATRIITTAKTYEIVAVSGTTPTRTFSITTTNTGSYIRSWFLEIVAITGTPASGDSLKIELLDSAGTVLASGTISPLTVGAFIEVLHNTNTKQIRVTLTTSQRIVVECIVHEGINIAYGIT
jgi:hypothetical protein